MLLRALDLKSSVSANSTTRAYHQYTTIISRSQAFFSSTFKGCWSDVISGFDPATLDCATAVMTYEYICQSMIKWPCTAFNHCLQQVRVEGLEPPRLATPEPKSGATANFAILALLPVFNELANICWG